MEIFWISIILFLEYSFVKCIYTNYDYDYKTDKKRYDKEDQVKFKLWAFVPWVIASLFASAIHLLLGIVVSIILLLIYGLIAIPYNDMYFHVSGPIRSLLEIKPIKKFFAFINKIINYEL